MATEGVQLTFEEAALKKIGMYTYSTHALANSATVHLINNDVDGVAVAAVSAEVNTTVENIGARRLHTVRNVYRLHTRAFGAPGKPAPRHAAGAKPWILGAGDSLGHQCRLRVLQLMERILEDVSYDAGDATGEVGPGAECVAAWH